MEDLSLMLLKHNMALSLLVLMRNYERCAGRGLFGVLSEKEQEVLTQTGATCQAIEELCAEYFDAEERASTI